MDIWAQLTSALYKAPLVHKVRKELLVRQAPPVLLEILVLKGQPAQTGHLAR
jgi:hypothetical protein